MKQDRPIMAEHLEDMEHANVTFRISPQPSRPKSKLLRIRKPRQCLKLQGCRGKSSPKRNRREASHAAVLWILTTTTT